MFEFIKGEVREITPTYVVLENNGIGYFINISINTYTKISESASCLLYIYEAIREDAHQLFGFADKEERQVFLHLISVSGIGSNTARVMLSSLSPSDIKTAIAQSNVMLIKSVKGIGTKTAERVIVDLRDKVGKLSETDQNNSLINNTIKEEALSALVMLGFPKAKVDKIINSILKENNSLRVEELIKESLKRI
jgi:Holliday junction DNA helicase RuvA